MREVKFRGKISNNNKWACGSLAINKNGSCQISDWNDDFRFWYDVFPGTVGEYSGMKDKNDIDIYEGDLFYYHDSLRVVTYREDKAAFMAELIKGHYGSCNFYLRDMHYISSNKINIEIIGNVYDNPKLLK